MQASETVVDVKYMNKSFKEASQSVREDKMFVNSFPISERVSPRFNLNANFLFFLKRWNKAYALFAALNWIN